MMTRKRAAATIASALGVGLISGFSAVAWAESDEGSRAQTPEEIHNSIQAPTAPPKPGSEPSVGPWTAGEAPPDLVPIQTEDGLDGYLRTYDMANLSPDKYKTRRVDENTVELLIPVYAEDGQTVVGEWAAGTATEE